MKRKILLAMACIAIITLAAASVRLWRVRAYIAGPSDAFCFIVSLCEDTTLFSPGYSESVFRSISPGEMKEDVHAQLGEPILTHADSSNDREYWRFTQGKPDRNYWLRVVVFDRTGRVQKVSREYFTD